MSSRSNVLMKNCRVRILDYEGTQVIPPITTDGPTDIVANIQELKAATPLPSATEDSINSDETPDVRFRIDVFDPPAQSGFAVVVTQSRRQPKFLGKQFNVLQVHSDTGALASDLLYSKYKNVSH